MDRLVLQLLRKRGHKRAEEALRGEVGVLSMEQYSEAQLQESELALTSLISTFNKEESPAFASSPQAAAQRLIESYLALKEWVSNSLELYKQELLAILYPIYVYCYLELVCSNLPEEARQFVEYRKEFEELHRTELIRVHAVSSAQHIATDEVCRTWRENKFRVSMSQVSFELLMNFLQANGCLLLLALINQRIKIKIVSVNPSPCPYQDYKSITEFNSKQLKEINAKKIHWGSFDETPAHISQPMQAGEAPPPSSEKPKRGKKKKDEDKTKENDGSAEAGAAPAEGAAPGAAAVATVLKPKSAVPLPQLGHATEHAINEDVLKRTPLNATSLPSVCFFTFFHTHSTLTHVSFSHDTALACGGFSDSSLRLWDLRAIAQQPPDAASAFATANASSLLYGHAGPVYASSFSPDNHWLLSCSEDNTARLWSVDTKTNIVCYKGHQSPVWDVQFSPLGYYFATASHDRTARLWATNQYAPIRIFIGHLSDVNCVRFHPNVNYLLTGSADKTVRMWELSTGACVRIMTSHVQSVGAVAVSPTGRIAASGADDGTVILWDLSTSKKLQTLTCGPNNSPFAPAPAASGAAFGSAHRASRAVHSLDFSAEGTVLAVGNANGVVRLYDVARATAAGATDSARAGGLARAQMEAAAAEEAGEPPELGGEYMLREFPTKQTPVFAVQFTRRNLLLAGGPYCPSS
eukprot:TRINITY_DN6540_c0_g1_i1.p1 TRINITY_DN6540_c0_g1~~TRINITY_DN6540_c0_g1_i1.p1  ORF type:complete len:775 (-),score=205.96 TRINITY_DN6540_c0_g1_i1:106-2187(-)